MNADLTQSIVRVLQRDGKTAGTGFIVSNTGLIATCAHVVEGYKPGEKVSIILFATKEKRQAVIEKAWLREPSAEDIAILRLPGTLPQDIVVLPLGYSSCVEGNTLVTFGFPANNPIEGLNGKCEVIGRTTQNGCPVLQLRSPEVTRGFSGAPVFNPVTSKLVGMITAITIPDKYGRLTETTFITPAEVLAGVCTEIENINVQKIVDNLASQSRLGDLFVNLTGQTWTDVIQERQQEVSVLEQLGLDPVFSLMQDSSDRSSQNSKRLLTTRDDLSEDIIEELGKHTHCVLIGEAGAGKTTILEKIVLDAAKNRLENINAPLPLYLKLSAWQIDQSPLDFIYAHWPFASSPLHLLPHGLVTLYLDGLNEMGSASKEKVHQLREWLHSEQRPKNIIVTCRVDDYVIGGLDLGFPVVKVRGMGESRIRQFAAKYLNALGKDAECFLTQIIPSNDQESTSSLFKLVRNPFMLTALIVAYASNDRLDVELPKNKGLLSKRLVRSLWDWEGKRNSVGWMPYGEAEISLSKLAFNMVDSDYATEIPIAQALKYCDRKLLQVAKSARIIEFNNENLKFYHQLIQEFFAAIELKRIGLSNKLQPPQVEDGQRKDARWDQVVIALCGISEIPDDIVAYILEKQDPYLAAMCIASGIQVNETTIGKTVSRLLDNINKWKWLDSEKRSEVACKALVDIGRPAVPFLINFLENDPRTMIQLEGTVKDTLKVVALGGALVGGYFLSISFPPAIFGMPWLAKSLRTTLMSPAFRHQLPRLAKEVEGGIDKIEIDPIRKVNLIKIVVMVLGEIGDSQAENILQNLCSHDPSDEVRETARLAIGKIKSKS